jgi:elongation factor G
MSASHATHAIRNVGILANIDAGKTTTTERMLAAAAGLRGDGYMAGDERGITITSAATSCSWKDAVVTLVEGPGALGLASDVERTLRVLDGALVLVDAAIDADGGPTLAARGHVQRSAAAHLVVVNKMDRAGADFARTLEGISAAEAAPVVALQMPIGSGRDFSGIVDLVTMTALTWSKTEAVVGPVPGTAVAEAARLRAALLAAVGVSDSAISVADLKVAVRRAVVSRAMTAAIVISAFQNRGVEQLLDAVVDYLPGPADRSAVDGWSAVNHQALTLAPTPDAPLAGLAFKAMTDPILGALLFVRLFSGSLSVGETVTSGNGARSGSETISRIIRMRSTEREDLDRAVAGDIVGLIGLKAVAVGDTLSNPSAPIVLELSATEPRGANGDHNGGQSGGLSGAVQPHARSA